MHLNNIVAMIKINWADQRRSAPTSHALGNGDAGFADTVRSRTGLVQNATAVMVGRAG